VNTFLLERVVVFTTFVTKFSVETQNVHIVSSKLTLQDFFVLHADIASSFPLTQLLEFHRQHGKPATILATQVPKDIATRYGCIVADPETKQVLHYVEKRTSPFSEVSY
jgi:NDP-sugar pyrophosphorylase family protein